MDSFTTVFLGTPDTLENLAKMMIRALIDYCGLSAGDADGLIADWGDNMSIVASTENPPTSTNTPLTLKTTSGGSFNISQQSSYPVVGSTLYLTYAKGVGGEVAFGFSTSATNFFMCVFLQPYDAAIFFSNGFFMTTADGGTQKPTLPSIASTSWPFIVLVQAPLPFAGGPKKLFDNLYVPYCLTSNVVGNYKTVEIVDGAQKYILTKAGTSGTVYMAMRVE